VQVGNNKIGSADKSGRQKVAESAIWLIEHQERNRPGFDIHIFYIYTARRRKCFFVSSFHIIMRVTFPMKLQSPHPGSLHPLHFETRDASVRASEQVLSEGWRGWTQREEPAWRTRQKPFRRRHLHVSPRSRGEPVARDKYRRFTIARLQGGVEQECDAE
jgi:hypothetical protein